MKKLESNTKMFTDKNNSLIVKNEYLIKAFKNGSRKNSIERESNNRKLAEILDEIIGVEVSLTVETVCEAIDKYSHPVTKKLTHPITANNIATPIIPLLDFFCSVISPPLIRII